MGCVQHGREGPLCDFLTWEREGRREGERERERERERGRGEGERERERQPRELGDCCSRIAFIFKQHLLNLFVCLFVFGSAACGILLALPGIEPGAPAVEAQSPNRWTAREFPNCIF